MTDWLVIRHLSGSKANRVERFASDALAELTIGRDPNATISFDPQRDDVVSRRHALIRINKTDGLSFRIVDLKSSNGTFLNGRRIDDAADLVAGDTLEIGHGGPRLLFEVRPATGAAARPAAVAAPMAAASPPSDPKPGDTAPAPLNNTPPPPPPSTSEMPEGSIFLSYARDDLAAVRALTRDLAAVGITAWFDLEQLGAGDTFDEHIRSSINRCSLFVPVLSANTEARREAYFRREWRYALDRDMSIDPSVRFIVPVAIDETKTFARVPRRFLEVHITWLPQGRATPEFISRIRRLLEQAPSHA